MNHSDIDNYIDECYVNHSDINNYIDESVI